MTSQISKLQWMRCVVAAVLCVFSFGIASAQQDSAQAVQQSPTPQSLLDSIALQQRIQAIQPDSVKPVYKEALYSVTYAVMNPQDAKSAGLLDSSDKLIKKLEGMQGADKSDVATLKAFYYCGLIMQNPMQNGMRYYMQVQQNLDEALKLNPDNEFAKMLKGQFEQGMKAAMQ